MVTTTLREESFKKHFDGHKVIVLYFFTKYYQRAIADQTEFLTSDV